jgi:hypothetical protein
MLNGRHDFDDHLQHLRAFLEDDSSERLDAEAALTGMLGVCRTRWLSELDDAIERFRSRFPEEPGPGSTVIESPGDAAGPDELTDFLAEASLRFADAPTGDEARRIVAVRERLLELQPKKGQGRPMQQEPPGKFKPPPRHPLATVAALTAGVVVIGLLIWLGVRK